MGIQTTQPSTSMSLSQADIQQWLKNTLVFLAPLAAIYLLSVLSVIQTPGHTASFSDLVPNTLTVGAIELYIFNSAYDIVRKFIASN